MAKWNYTLQWGKQLHEAIKAEDTTMVVKCLIACYRELLNKLSEEDKEWKGFDIEDSIEILTYYAADPDDEDNVDYYLDEFYDICDDVRAWITI
jgi:archaellum biogenesis ATPase FlaH